MELQGPIQLPLELQSGEVVDFRLYFATGRSTRYLVATHALEGAAKPLVRIESACLFGHVFRSRRCDCGYQLQAACDRIGREGGMVIYGIDEDGRGLGIEGHFRTYMLRQLEQLDTTAVYQRLGVPLDQRDYTDIAAILQHFALTDVRILTNNPRRLAFLEQAGIRFERVPHERQVDRHSAVSMLDKASALPYMFSFAWHSAYLRRLEPLARDGLVNGIVLDDCKDESGWSLSSDSPAAQFAGLLPRTERATPPYRILYADRMPPSAWLSEAVSAGVELLVLPREHADAEALDAARALGLLVDTVGMAEAQPSHRPPGDAER